MIGKEILTVEEVAELLSVEARTVQRWVTSMALPHMRLGRLLRFNRSSLLVWALEQERRTMAGELDTPDEEPGPEPEPPKRKERRRQ